MWKEGPWRVFYKIFEELEGFMGSRHSFLYELTQVEQGPVGVSSSKIDFFFLLIQYSDFSNIQSNSNLH